MSKKEDNINVTLTKEEYQIVKYSMVALIKTIMNIQKMKGLSAQQAKEAMYGKEHEFFEQIELTLNKLNIDGECYKKTHKELTEQFDKIAEL